MPDDETVTCKVPKEMAEWLSKTAFDIDRTKSELIRCSLLLSVDTIKATPSLIDRIQYADRVNKSNNI